MATIAIIGLGGFLGAPVLDALQSSSFADKVKFPILAVTRDASKHKSTDKVKFIGGDYTTETDRLAKELSGTDVVIELVNADPSLFAATQKLVAQVKPKLVIPSSFGVDLKESQEIFPGFLKIKLDHFEKLRSDGFKAVDITTGLFGKKNSIVSSIAPFLGADTGSRTFTYYGKPTTEFSYSILEDIGYAVAAVAVTEPSKLPDQVRINSGTISLQELNKKFSSEKEVELETKEVSPEDALKEAKEVWSEGFNPQKFVYYLKAIASQGEEKGLWFTKTENELINPGQKLWKWTTI